MVTELQKRCIEEASHEKLKNDAYAMLMNEEYYQSEIKRLEEENKKLKEEVEQLKNKRIFSSDEYDLITLTSTTPQWELRRK